LYVPDVSPQKGEKLRKLPRLDPEAGSLGHWVVKKLRSKKLAIQAILSVVLSRLKGETDNEAMTEVEVVYIYGHGGVGKSEGEKG